MKYYRILLQNEEENIRYFSPMVYKQLELNLSTEYDIKRDSVVLLSESTGMMDECLIQKIVANTKVVGKVETKVEEF